MSPTYKIKFLNQVVLVEEVNSEEIFFLVPISTVARELGLLFWFQTFPYEEFPTAYTCESRI